MGVETPEVPEESSPEAVIADFTQSNRLQRFKGRLFEAVCFLSTAVGLIALAALLGLVSWDGLGLGAADPSWLVMTTGGILASSVAVLEYVRTDPVRRAAATSSTAAIIGGAIVGTFLVTFMLILSAPTWFAYAVGAFLPATAVYARITIRRYRLLATALVLAGGTTIVARGAGEPIVTTVTGVPAWQLYFVTIVVPAAIGIGARIGRSHGRQWGLATGSAMLISFGAIGAAAPDPEPLTAGHVMLFSLCLIVPVTIVVWNHWVADNGNGVATAAPLLVVGGTALAAGIASAIGFTPPEPWLTWDFLTSPHSRHPDNAGLYPPIVGSFFLMIVMALFAFPVSVAAALYLEEFAPKTGLRGRFVQLIQINIANLAGVPSVVYGLLGLAVIANGISFGSFELWGGFGIGTVLSASLALGLLIMPITIIAAREAIRSVPEEYRNAAYAMGSSDWQALRSVILPQALPGILTGTILALGRAIGETAPLIMVGAATVKYSPPSALGDGATAMPMQIFAWAGEFIAEFRTDVLSAGVLTLLIALLAMNALAILLRNRYEREA